jgi:hypothetical protein
MAATTKKRSPQSSPSPVETVSNRIIDVLANLSATDSWHDFHDNIKKFSDIIADNKETYCEGLPIGVTSLGKYNDEGHALSSVVKTKDGSPLSDFGEVLIRTNTRVYKESQPQYNITTINDTVYSVKPLVVAHGSKKSEGGKDYINAKEFCDILEIANNSGIIIDAAAVSVLTILKEGAPVMEGSERKRMFYIMTPEVINDPADKTSVADKIFKNDDANPEGVKIVSCEPNIPESINYNYSYDKHINTGELLKSETTNIYDKFFSAYNFQLSEIQRNRKGKKLDYTTNLLIKSNDSRIPVPENVLDSKTKNSITFLTSLILGALKSLEGKKDTLKNKFLFNSKLQQKRSGDWLQVLACLLVKSRKLKEYNEPGKPPGMQEIEKIITNIYFVTHDRIALSFALLLGVECIYTHTATKSCYIFKLSSPEARAASNMRFLEIKKNDLDLIRTKLTENLAYYEGTQKAQLLEYNKFRDQNITKKYPGEITGLNRKYPDLFKSSTTFNATDFTKFTCETFELCLLYEYLLLNFPKLNEDSDGTSVDPLTSKITEVLTSIPITINKLYDQTTQTFIVPPTEEAFKSLKEEIDLLTNAYNSIMGKISMLETSLDKYTTTKPVKLKINIATTITNFQKTPNRKMASGWSWDNTQGNSRMWEAFKDLIGSTSYKSDKNTFLYNLTLLDTDIKDFLCTKYLELKNRITSNPAPAIIENIGKAATPTAITSEPRITKFKVVTLGFVAEVFLNFGFKIPTETASGENPQYTSLITDAINRVDSVIDSVSRESVKLTAFSEGDIISENSEATVMNVTAQNPPENYILEKTTLNYSTEVNPSPTISDGRPVVDSVTISKTSDELGKKLVELDEVVEVALEETKDEAPVEEPSNHLNPRENLDDDVEFKTAKNAAIKKAIEEGPTEVVLTQGAESLEIPIENQVKTEIINDVIQNVKDSMRNSIEIRENLKAPTPEESIEIDKVRKPIEIAPLINNDGLNIRNSPKLLGADFELNIKDATYVLLNALLGYKSNPAELARFESEIRPFLDKFHEDFVDREQTGIEEEPEEVEGSASGVSELSVMPPPPPPTLQVGSRTLRVGIDTLHYLPKPPKSRSRMIGGDGSSSIDEEDILNIEAFFKTLSLPPVEDDGSKKEDINLITDVNYLFHPLLPIYMIAESLNEIAGNDNIHESLDYEHYQLYLKFLIKLRHGVLELYRSGKVLDVVKAYVIGTGLREFFFYGDIYSMGTQEQHGGRREVANEPQLKLSSPFQTAQDEDESLVDVGEGKKTKESEPEPDFEFEVEHSPIPGSESESEPYSSEITNDSYCENVLGLTKKEFRPISLLTSVFSNYICGIIIRNKEEIEFGEKIIKSDIFTDFFKGLNISSIFKESIEIPESVSSFKRNCLVFLLETGNEITNDRGGTLIEIPDETLTNPFHPDRVTLRDIQATAAESRRDSSQRGELGGSKKNRVKKRNHKTRRNGKTKRGGTRNHRKNKVKKYTKRN